MVIDVCSVGCYVAIEGGVRAGVECTHVFCLGLVGDGVDGVFKALVLGSRYWLHVGGSIFIIIVDGLLQLGSGGDGDH